MGKIQETEKVTRIAAIMGGIIGSINSIILLLEVSLFSLSSIILIIMLIISILAIFLGIKPLRYTPVFLYIIGVAILFTSFISGGIIIMGTTIGYFWDHDNRGIIRG